MAPNVALGHASAKGLRLRNPQFSRRVFVSRAEDKRREPVKFKDIPPSRRMFTNEQWDSALQGQGTSSSSRSPASQRPVSIQEAFAFSGPLPEIANGRMAMLGFAGVAGVEVATGQPLVAQFSGATGLVISTTFLFTIASLFPVLKGGNLSRAVGPFSPQAELVNGRLAMMGMAALIIIENFSGKAFI